tara:strand:- start:195 stop:329 length:135 start_codon:yes stop_codon:yes gene_type:complete
MSKYFEEIQLEQYLKKQSKPTIESKLDYIICKIDLIEKLLKKIK